MPDFDVPINNARAPNCLRNMKPYFNFAEIFDCDMIRVGLKSEADILAQRAADEAAERKLRLTHHNEGNTMFETFGFPSVEDIESNQLPELRHHLR